MNKGIEEMLKYAREELKVLREQGCDTWDLERTVELLEKDAGPAPGQKLEGVIKAIEGLLPGDDFPYDEPSKLEAIRAVRPDGPRRIAVPLSEADIANRTRGAWVGRVAGCMLGKPVEGWPREKIRDLLNACGEEALTDYMPRPPESSSMQFPEHASGLLRGSISGAARDDDIDYTIVGLCVLEDHGREFTPGHMADFWLARMPFRCTYTAERAAYRNFVNGIRPPESAVYRNPYREWIGAQIRADAFGYACPGRPEEAAGLAFKDACISHTRNGIYGEMWVAATLAAAFVGGEMTRTIELGLTEIPQNCRLAETIRQVLAWHAEGLSADEATTRLLTEYGDYHPVHTINNASIVAMGLLWGEGDFSHTIGLAVEAGLDTDCNGATAGSVLGAMMGAEAIPAHWTEPLDGRVETVVAWQKDLTISGLVERTRRVQEQ